jgi:hypothetical protein
MAGTKDRSEIKAIAAAQAGFSSLREETCRDYVREDQHGFCAARVTEAHALALRAKLYPDAEDKPVAKKRPARPRRKPAAPASASAQPPR